MSCSRRLQDPGSEVPGRSEATHRGVPCSQPLKAPATPRSPSTTSRRQRVAALRGTSVTALVIEGLRRATSGNDDYEAALQRQVALMRAGERLRRDGEPMPTREAAHERSHER